MCLQADGGLKMRTRVNTAQGSGKESKSRAQDIFYPFLFLKYSGIVTLVLSKSIHH